LVSVNDELAGVTKFATNFHKVRWSDEAPVAPSSIEPT